MSADLGLQNQLGQALSLCGNPGDVLRLIEEFRHRQQSMPSSGNMATAMHRIASTGAQEAADRDKVIQDRRFQHMVLNVEHNLKQMPESFGEQHLANVVWGAAKLRLQREDLFHFVQREVLSPRRQLDKFSPQQLAAIAWSYAMVNYQAPRLFEAVREEASRKPPLAEMLSKAGLMRDGNALSAAGGQRQAVSGAKSGVQQAGVGQANSAGLGQGMQNNGGMVNGPLQQRAQAQGQQRYGAHPPSQPQQQQQQPQPQPQQPHVQRPQQTSHAGPPSGYNQYDAGNGPGGQDASHGVARAAEEHKKEMEEKQRQVLGGEDGGELCPLCVEEMDSTDMALLPCPCGYQICLLCLNKIRNEGNKQCPACRSEYEEGNFRKVEPPPKKKKNEARADDEGWESSTSKKKTGEKKKQPLSFPGFAPRVSDMLAQCHEAGVVSKGELDERVMEDLKALPERGAIAVLSEFMKKDMTRIRNKSAFVNGIIDRVQKELAHDKTGGSLSGGGGGAPHGGWHGNQPLGYNAPVPEQQRPRGMSDIDSHNRPSMPPAGVQQQQKAQQLQPQPQQAMAGARPQQPIGGSGGVIGGGMQRGGGGGMGMLSWSAADDEEVDHMQNSLRGLGLGGGEKMGGASGDNSVLAGLAHDDQEAAEVERARQQVEQFLMSRGAGAQVQQQPPQHQQQFGGQGELPALGVGGLVPMGSAPMGSAPMGAFGGVGGLQDNLLGGLGAMSQGGGMRAPGASNMRAPGPIGSGHARQSDEQARADAEAGSRLLEYITRGGGNGGASEAEPKSKLPLFMRVNGGGHNVDGLDADSWNTELGPRPPVATTSWEEGDGVIDRCFQCGRDGRGDVDQTDGQFYCNDCWGAFEVWRSSQSVNHGARQDPHGRGDDIRA